MRSEPLRLRPEDERKRVVIAGFTQMLRSPFFTQAVKDMISDAISIIKDKPDNPTTITPKDYFRATHYAGVSRNGLLLEMQILSDQVKTTRTREYNLTKPIQVILADNEHLADDELSDHMTKDVADAIITLRKVMVS